MNGLRILALLAALGAGTAFGEDTAAPEEDAATSGYEQAQAAIEAGNFAGALPILAALTAAEPDNADAWNLLGYAARKSGDLAAAGLAYDRALKLDPDHLGALEYQGELYLETGKPDQAKANLARLRSLCGDCEEAEDLAQALAAAGF